MRIAMIHWGYPPVIGGVETHLSQLCPALVRAGHHVSLLTGSHVDEKRRDYVDRGVHIRRRQVMDLHWLFERGVATVEAEIAGEIKAFLDKFQPDVMHAHNMNYFSEVHARVLATEAVRRNIPIVLTAHNAWDNMQFFTLTREIPWDQIIAISRYIEMELLGCGIEKERVTMIHHGIEAAAFLKASPAKALKKYPQLKGRKVVFHPARTTLAKGSAVVVKAFRLIRERVPEAFLVLAGTKNAIDWGRYQQAEIAYVNRLSEEFELKKDMLVDFFPHDFIPTMYAASDVCVYPSIFPEPFGLVTLEAMASAKPIVVARSGGLPEIIKTGVSGVVVPPRDHRALARAVVRFLEDKKAARAFGARGRAILKKRHSLAQMMASVLSVYRRAIAEKKDRHTI